MDDGGPPPPRVGADLWYATVTAESHRQWGRVNATAGIWADQPEPPCIEGADVARSSLLPDDLLD